MTQAYNLSQLANNLNSSGQLDATDGLVNAVPVANGGTGASSASAARTNLSVPSTTGSGASGTWAISISGNAATATSATSATSASSVTNGVYTEGNQTINGLKKFTSGVQFNDNTTQTSAATPARSWQSFSMSNNVNYTNTYGIEIFVAARCNTNGAYGWTDYCYVDDVVISQAQWDGVVAGDTYIFPVPAGSTFRVNFAPGIAFAKLYK